MRGRPVRRSSLAAALLLVAGASGAEQPTADAAGWESLLGERPSAQLGGRWIVVLAKPSLATRVAAAGGVATEEQERAWTAAARDAQNEVIARLAFRGAPIEPEHAYYRVLNGFATPLDARALAIVVRDPDVRGVFPVRAAIPAEVDPDAVDDLVDVAGGRRPNIGIPGFSGEGVTVALLDTGVDLVHPYIRGALGRGLDVLDPGGDASARQNPTAPGRPERHGTEMAGLVAGSNGPAGLHGVAPGAALLPIRVAGWQPDTSGGVSVYGRTDQVLAGIELAVDPNEDGDAHDAARITLVGVVEPFAAFADGPLAAAAAGALALDSLVVTAAGNDGPAGPAYGSIGGPGGAPAALTAGAIDTRRRSPTGHVLLLAGLRSLVSGVQPLGGVVASVALPVRARRRAPTHRHGGRRCSRRPHAALRQLRVQPRRRRGRAAPARNLVARGRPRGRRGRCAGGARRRAAAGRVARHGRPGRGADPGAVRRRRRGRAGGAPECDPGDARRRCCGVRHERGSGSRRAVLVGGPRLRRRPEAGGERRRHRARDLRPGPERGRRRPLRDAQRHERGGGARPRARRPCSPRRGPISTPRA